MSPPWPSQTTLRLPFDFPRGPEMLRSWAGTTQLIWQPVGLSDPGGPNSKTL